MKKIDKQIIGAIGLAFVSALTAIAVAIPAPAANAANSGDVKIEITVENQTASLMLSEPADNSVFAKPSVDVSTTFQNTNAIDYTLKYTDPSGVVQTFNLPSRSVSGTSGTDNFVLDLSNYGSYGTYVLTASIPGTSAISDVTRFVYRASNIGGEDTDGDGQPDAPITFDQNGDPVITAYYDTTVCSIHFQAYNKTTGDPLFNPEYIWIVPVPRPNPGVSQVTLPFSRHNAVAGDYKIVATPYDCSNGEGQDGNNPVVPGQSEVDVDNYVPNGPSGYDDQTGDPKILMDYPANACSIHIQVYDKTTNTAQFNPEYVFDLPQPLPSNLQSEITVPFSRYVTNPGDYYIHAIAYDCNDAPIAGSDRWFDVNGYTPKEAPLTPNTGGGFFAGLNLSRGDYLATGLIIFGIGAIAAFRIINKSKKSTKRKSRR